MTGDENTQPVEGELTLSDLADGIDTGSDEQEEIDLEEGQAEGDEQEEPQGDEEGEPQDEPTFTLKHEGKEVTLKQSELLELGQKGYDYTQKTMALAEERKAVDSVRSEVQQLRQQELDRLEFANAQLGHLEQFIESQIGVPPPISLAQENPATYLAQKELYDARKGQLQHVKEAAAATHQEAQRRRQAQLAEKANATEKALRDTLPGWNDELMNDLATYLGKSGISPQGSVEAFIEEGVWKLAAKAKAYDDLLAQKATLKPKAELPRVQKPSTARQPNQAETKRVEAMKRYNSNPNINNLAELI